jgi:demethylmenaquinone methyltransferase/2-methoxy-6-polyprenyl-1,4-benzoquinol methylase
MSEAVRSMFDTIAGRYDTLNHTLSAYRDLSWRRKAVGMLPLPKQGAWVLDLCGGTGDFCLALRHRGVQSACVIGDFSEPMLKLGKGKKLFASMVAMDALKPPFKMGTFDVVLCGFGMRNLDHLEEGVRTIHDLLKPGGIFLTLDFFRPSTVFTRFFYRMLAPLFIPVLGSVMGSKREAYEYLVKSVQRFKSAEEYAIGCRDVGFKRVEIKACDFGIAHAVMAVKG